MAAVRGAMTWGRLGAASLAVSTALGLIPAAGAPQPKGPSLSGYRLVRVERVAKGLTHYTYLASSPRQVLHVAKMDAGAALTLRATVGRGRVAGPGPLVERTSDMCKRVRCLVAVNGDFFARGVPIGGMVVAGEPVRSGRAGRPQLIAGPKGAVVRDLVLRGEVVSSYPTVTRPGLEIPAVEVPRVDVPRVEAPRPDVPGVERPSEIDAALAQAPSVEATSVEAPPVDTPVKPARALDGTPLEPEPVTTIEERATPIDAVNVARARDEIVLYTPRFGSRTATGGGVEIAVRVLDPKPPLRLNSPAQVRLTGIRRAGNSAIPSDGAILSGSGEGAEALVRLWDDHQSGRALPDPVLRTRAPLPGALESIGGRPVILRDGEIFDPGRSWFARSRQPRTLAGVTRAGDVLLATADGRRAGHSVGISLVHAAKVMRALGAVHAINLDGGGSTTFVVRGAVRNVPSDRLVVKGGRTRVARSAAPGVRVKRSSWERPVANAIAIVAAG